MSDTYQQMVPTFAPPWMTGPNGLVLLQAFGAELDTRADQIMWARLQSNPYAGGPNATREGGARLADGRLIECDPWVLNIHALERGVRLYRTETTLARRIRISRWRQYHAQRGTHRGALLNVLRPYFLGLGVTPRIRLVHRSGTGIDVWHTVEEDGRYTVALGAANWNFGGTGRSRFWVIIYDKTVDGTAVPGLGDDTMAHYDDGIAEYDDGITVYDGLSYEVAADLVDMCQDHAAHSKLAGVIIAHDTTDFNPAQAPSADAYGRWNFPSGGNWLAPQYMNRNPRCSFIYDNA